MQSLVLHHGSDKHAANFRTAETSVECLCHNICKDLNCHRSHPDIKERQWLGIRYL